MADKIDMDALFKAAAMERMEPSQDLIDRVLADAALSQPRTVLARGKPAGGSRGLSLNWLAQIFGVGGGAGGGFGGGGVLAGLGVASVAGLYLGLVQPAPLGDWAEALIGEQPLDMMEMMPGIDALLAKE